MSSEPELAYMSNANDDFDLPRWQTHQHQPIDPLSSSQAAHAAARASYLYPPQGQPQPQSQNQQQQFASAPQQAQGQGQQQQGQLPLQTQLTGGHSHSQSPQRYNTTAGTAPRPPRIAQLVDEQGPYAPQHHLQGGGAPSIGVAIGGPGPPPPLSRSASLNSAAGVGVGSATSPSSGKTARRHHQPEDLEPYPPMSGAFADAHAHPHGHGHGHSSPMTSPRNVGGGGPPAVNPSLYPGSVGHHSGASGSSLGSMGGAVSPASSMLSSGGGMGAGDNFADLYYNGGGGAAGARRSQSERGGGRSPLRTGNALLDSYAQQQAAYSPTQASQAQAQAQAQASSAYLLSGDGSAGSRHSRSHSQQSHDPEGSSNGGGVSVNVTPPYPPTSAGAGAYGPSLTETSPPPPPPPPKTFEHLIPGAAASGRASLSTPSSPLSYGHQGGQVYAPSHSPYYGQEHMMVDTPNPQQQQQQQLQGQQGQGQGQQGQGGQGQGQHRRRASGFRRVRDGRDLRPYVNQQPAGRRVDERGVFLSPLRQLTTSILETYRICNPAFRYESTHNPRRVLTKPSKPAHNDGYDNEEYDYILYVNDLLGSEDGHNRYLILDILGQGTFGQVVKCQNMKNHEIVAVKVVKNKPAYFNQSMMEVTILELLNNQCDPQDEHHILRLRDSFIHKNHLCLVFELLSSNLYELIKQNQFQGLSTQLVKVFTAQLLDALSVLKDARLIHCDLKPENILLKSLQSPQIKVIDFGSACHERQTVYTYIQSRFYRSPEVILGIPYTASIDMWSLGCIAVELFLGLPLFPGTSEYNQITRIVEMLGMPPTYMLDMGKQTKQFFDSFVDVYGQKKYRLKSLEQYSREHGTNEQPGKQYFKATTLPEIVNQAPMPSFKSSSRQGHEVEKELNNRASFIDFCQGLLNLNPIERWSPQQARMHPFITGEKFTKPFSPNGVSAQMSTSSPSGSSDPKRPYGGLVPSQPKGTRAYQDAASYNQHLAQHQAYTAQAQAASQAANNVHRNPYISPPGPAHQSSSGGSSSVPMQVSGYGPNAPPQPDGPSAFPSSTHYGYAGSSQGAPQAGGQMQNAPSAGSSAYNQSSTLNLLVPGQQQGPPAPASTYYPNAHARTRANTINHQLDAVPPALARLQHMNTDVIGGRNALTPVLNRDDAMREWERRQAGKASTAQPYPQLEYLQQQAELVAAGGMPAGAGAGGSGAWPAGQGPGAGAARYAGSKLTHSYQPTIVVDDDRREQVMSTVRNAARVEAGGSGSYNPAGVVTSPTAAYQPGGGAGGGGGGGGGGPRYQQPYSGQPTSPFDSLGQRTDIGTMYVPMQPEQYQSYAPGARSAGGAGGSGMGGGAGGQPSFYGAGVAAAVSQARGNPFPGQGQSGGGGGGQGEGQGVKDSRRMSGMDIWNAR